MAANTRRFCARFDARVLHVHAHMHVRPLTISPCGEVDSCHLADAFTALATRHLQPYMCMSPAGYDYPALSRCLDHIVPMAYDMTGRSVAANAPLPAILDGTVHVSTTPAPRQHHASTTSAPRQHRVSTTSAPRQHRVSTVSAPCQRAAPCHPGRYRTHGPERGTPFDHDCRANPVLTRDASKCDCWRNGATAQRCNGAAGVSRQYKALGIDPSRLVVALPWYAYDFTCAPTPHAPDCDLPPGGHHANWSASSRQLGYGQVLDLHAAVGSPPITLNTSSVSKRFDYVNATTKQRHRVSFDDPETLLVKYPSRAVQFHPNGGQFDFARLPARTPHGVHRTCGA